MTVVNCNDRVRIIMIASSESSEFTAFRVSGRRLMSPQTGKIRAVCKKGKKRTATVELSFKIGRLV